MPVKDYKRAKQILENNPGFADDGYYRYALITQLEFEHWRCVEETFFKYDSSINGYKFIGKAHKYNLSNLWQ